MGSILQVKELKARKKALAAESEIYRQTLSLEIHNLRLYGYQMRRRLTSWSSNPLVRFAPLALALLRGGRRRGRSGLFGKFRMALLLWQTYQKFAPTVWNLISSKMRRPSSNGAMAGMERAARRSEE